MKSSHLISSRPTSRLTSPIRLPLIAFASCAGAIVLAGCGGGTAENTAADAGSGTGATNSGSTASTGSAANAGSDNAARGTNSSSTASTGASIGGAPVDLKKLKFDAKNLKLAFVCNNASDFWTIARKGTQKADAELKNATVEFVIPSESSAAEQKRKVDDLLAGDINGIAISPSDPANQGDLIDRAALQALVFTQDSDAPNSNRACYVGTNNRDAGREAGELVKKALPNGGKIMLFVGKRDAQNAADREAGIRDALKGTKVEIVDVRTDDTDRAKAKANVADALVSTPDLAGCVGLWSYNAPAILGAVKDANAVGKVKIIAFDEEDDTLDGVASGAIFGTIVQQPYEFGYQSMKLLSRVLSGDTKAIPANRQVIVPTKTIDKNNVEAFRADLKKLRA